MVWKCRHRHLSQGPWVTESWKGPLRQSYKSTQARRLRLQGMAPACTSQWQDLTGVLCPQPWPRAHVPHSINPLCISPVLLHHHLSPAACQQDGAGVCCFVPRTQMGPGMLWDNRLPPARHQDSTHCLLAGMWAWNSLVEGTGLGLSSRLRLLPFSLGSPLGCWESRLMARRPHFPRQFSPGRKEEEGPLGQR